MSGKKKIIRYETDSGVMVHITPINIGTLTAITLKAQEVYPYPDKEPYRLPLENTFVEGQTDAAENNPEYRALCAKIDHERAQWRDKAVFMYCVRFPEYPAPSDLVDAFRSELTALRKIAVLPEDDYEAVLHHIILTWNTVAFGTNKELVASNSEYARIIHMAIQTVALTPEEIENGVRFFRPDLPERTPRKMAG